MPFFCKVLDLVTSEWAAIMQPFGMLAQFSIIDPAPIQTSLPIRTGSDSNG